jgi:hypothetical protein
MSQTGISVSLVDQAQEMLAGQNRRLDVARFRSPAKRNVDRRVLSVDVYFHHLDVYAPTWTGPREKTQDERNFKQAARNLRFPIPRHSVPASLLDPITNQMGRRPRADSWWRRQSVIVGERQIVDQSRAVNLSLMLLFSCPSHS